MEEDNRTKLYGSAVAAGLFTISAKLAHMYIPAFSWDVLFTYLLCFTSIYLVVTTEL